MKKLRIKWGNVFLLLWLICSVALIIHDLYYIVIYPYLTSYMTTYTWFGFGTALVALLVIYEVIDYFMEQL